MPQLLMKEGPGKGDIVELSKEGATLGRDACNSMHIDDRTVSRRHARIGEQEGQFYVADLGSHNGTIVNGERADRAQLFHMDEIRLGNVVLLFLEDEVTDIDALLTSSDTEPEVTQTIVWEGPNELADVTAAPRSELSVSSRRLLALTELSQAATKIRSLPVLADLLTGIVKRTLAPDRIVPIVRQDDERLLPYTRGDSGFAKGIEGIAISTRTVQHCLRKGVAVLSQGSHETAPQTAGRPAGGASPASCACRSARDALSTG